MNWYKCKTCQTCHRGNASNDNLPMCKLASQMCFSCYQPRLSTKLHLCPWKIPKPSKYLNNLAFFHFQYFSVVEECLACLSASCQEHPFSPHTDLTPILASVLYEDEKHELFSLRHFYHPKFNKGVSSMKHCLQFNYLPKGHGLSNTLSSQKKVAAFNKTRAANKHFTKSLERLKNKSDKSVAEQFLVEVFCESYRNFTFVSTESKAIDYLVRALVEIGAKPDIIVKGNQVILLNDNYFDIRFICINKFLNGNANELNSTFGLKKEMSYLPTVDCFKAAEVTEMACPHFDNFRDITDTKGKINEKRQYWEKIKDEPYNYLQSLESFAYTNLQIYALAGLHFTKISMDFQSKCHLNFQTPKLMTKDCVPVVSAFMFASTPAFVKSTFRMFALPENTLYSVKGEYGKKKGISQIEHEAVEYLRHKQPKQWVTSYSSSKGQKKFFKLGEKREFLIADAYNPISKTCFLFCGCYFHSHPNCHLLKDKNQNLDKYYRMRQQIVDVLVHCHTQVTSVAVLWECHFRQLKNPSPEYCHILQGETFISPFEELKTDNAELHNFLAGALFRPYEGMIIRDALRAATCEAYALKFVKKPGDGKVGHCLDMSSLYPFAAINFPLPYGEYFKLVGDEIQDIDFDDSFSTMRHKGSDVIAIVHCRVHPPSNLLHPLLQTTVKDMSVLTLCRTCSENTTQFEGSTYCGHDKLERSFVGTYTSQELAYGKSLGYGYDFFELAVYPNSGFFLAKFLTLLGFYKLRYCDLPNDNQASYCNDLNERMRFKDILGFELKPDMISPNPRMREVYKTFLNYFLGTFGVNEEKLVDVEFLDSYQQLLEHMLDDRVIDLEPMTDAILRVTLSKKNIGQSRSSNVSIACAVTSIARVIMHRHVQTLQEMKATIFRVACDSIIFVTEESQVLPFILSEAFGCFKKVYPTVEGVAQAGVQLVSVLYRTETGELKEKIVASGATMSESNSSVLSHASFDKMADHLVKSRIVDFSCFKVTAVRTTKKRLKVGTVVRQQNIFSRKLFARRQILDKTENYMTLPYGWRESL